MTIDVVKFLIMLLLLYGAPRAALAFVCIHLFTELAFVSSDNGFTVNIVSAVGVASVSAYWWRLAIKYRLAFFSLSIVYFINCIDYLLFNAGIIIYPDTFISKWFPHIINTLDTGVIILLIMDGWNRNVRMVYSIYSFFSERILPRNTDTVNRRVSNVAVINPHRRKVESNKR